MLGFVPQAIFGALSVEPTMWVAQMMAPFAPMMPASFFYPLVGLFVASAIQWIPGIAKVTKDKLAIAVASAAGGVGYYKARTGADAEMINEAGMLEYRGIGSFGSVLQLRPYAGNPYGYAYNPHQIQQVPSPMYVGGGNTYAGYGDGLAYQVRPFG